MILDLIDDLRRTRDNARSISSRLARYSFGARDLIVYGSAAATRWLPVGGLLPGREADVDRPSVDLYLIDRDERDALRFPADGVLSAYGAVTESAATDWRILHDPDGGRMLALDRAAGTALYYPGESVPPRELAEFCRPLLHWLAIGDGNVVIHAGALALDGRALLVAGTGNAGKSTLTRVCLEAGFAFLGDNVVEVELGGTVAPRIHAVYPTAKIRPNPAVSIPASWPEPQWDDEAQKHIYFLADLVADGDRSEAPLHVATLVLDERASAEVVPLSRAEAFFRVAPNTVGQFPFFEAEALSRSGAVVAQAPTFTAGRLPIDHMPRLIGSLLAPFEEVAHAR